MYTLMTLRCTESYFSCLFNLQLLLLCLRTSKKVGSTYKWYNLSVGGKQKHKPSFDGKAPISWAKTGHPDACAGGGGKKTKKGKEIRYIITNRAITTCVLTHTHILPVEPTAKLNQIVCIRKSEMTVIHLDMPSNVYPPALLHIDRCRYCWSEV